MFRTFDFVERTKFHEKIVRHCCRLATKSTVASAESNVASTLLLVWMGLNRGHRWTLTETGSRLLQSTSGGAMSHQSDGSVNWASPSVSGSLSRLSGLFDASVMFMYVDWMLIGVSPGTRRASSSVAMLSTTSIIILGTALDACHQYSTFADRQQSKCASCTTEISNLSNDVATINVVLPFLSVATGLFPS